MTVAAEVPLTLYDGDGVTVAFPAPWRYLDVAHLLVEVIDADGVATARTLGTHYAATPGSTDAGGTVTMVTAPAIGEALRIRRATPKAQPTAYPTTGAFPAQSHELALDRLMLVAQETDGEVDDVQTRALQVPFGEVAETLPNIDARKGKFLAFNASGVPIASDAAGTDGGLRSDLASSEDGKGPDLVFGLNQRIFSKVDLPAVLGSQLGIGYRVSYNGADARYLGGMWPATNYCAWLFEAKFTAANTPGSGESPASTAFFYAENDGSEKDVLAGMFVTYLKTATGAGFSTNHIVTGDIGLIGAKYVCSEFDIQPAAGATVDANSICIPVNAFSAPIPTCFQIGGVGGGDFVNVLVAYTGTGAVLAGGAGATLGSLFNTGGAAYTAAAGVFSNEHSLQFSGTAGSHFTMRCDSGNNFRVKFGGGVFIFRDPSDISSVAVIGQDGSAAFGANASVGAGYKVDTAADIGGDGVGLFRGSTSTGVVSVELQTATGAAGNAAGATARFRANGTTGRAVNAGGTINASGADYAEYEWLAPGVPGFRKGDVVGFNPAGLLTDRFADAVRFAVKSTNPNLVGGDDWESMVPANPERPVFQPPEYTGTRDPGPTWPKAEYPAGYTALRQDFVEKVRASQEAKKGSARARRLQNEIADIQQQLEVMRFEKDASDTALHAQWEADKERYQTESAAHEAAVEAAHATWKATVLADWYDAVIALENQREALRARVERIAYCGKVPVNAPTGKSGDYLVPCDDGKGGITARVVARADLTDADSLIRLGSINRTLADGRPEVVVHVG